MKKLKTWLFMLKYRFIIGLIHNIKVSNAYWVILKMLTKQLGKQCRISMIKLLVMQLQQLKTIKVLSIYQKYKIEMHI
jgi:hypothetical protein